MCERVCVCVCVVLIHTCVIPWVQLVSNNDTFVFVTVKSKGSVFEVGG